MSLTTLCIERVGRLWRVLTGGQSDYASRHKCD